MTRLRVFSLLVVVLASAAGAIVPNARPASAAGGWVCGAYDQTGKRGREPVPDAGGRIYPIVTIHGITGTDEDFDKIIDKSMIGASPQPPRTLLDALAGMGDGPVPPGVDHAHVYSFSYTPDSLRWIDHDQLGPRFARTIDCLYERFKTPVSVVAHSMGGLITRWVANSSDDHGVLRASKLGKIITLGTPYGGSWLSSVANGATDGLSIGVPALALLNYLCGDIGTNTGKGSCGPIPLYASFRSEAGRNMRVDDSALTRLRRWPASTDVSTIAGSQKIPLGLFGAPVNTTIDYGDLVVATGSATADPSAGQVFECRYDTAASTVGAALRRILLISDPLERHRRLTNAFVSSPCYHSALMQNVSVTNEVLGSLSDWIAAQNFNASQLRSAPVPSLCEHPAGSLVDGSLPGIPEIDGGVSIDLVERRPVLADFDDDGTSEIVAVADCNRGGVGWPTSLLLYGPGPTYLDEFSLEKIADRLPEYTGNRRGMAYPLQVRDGQVHTFWRGQRMSDTGAGSSLPIEVILDVRDGHFVLLSAVVHNETELLDAVTAAANQHDQAALEALPGGADYAQRLLDAVDAGGPFLRYECYGELDQIDAAGGSYLYELGFTGSRRCYFEQSDGGVAYNTEYVDVVNDHSSSGRATWRITDALKPP